MTKSIQLRSDVSLGILTMECAPKMYRWLCDPIIRNNLGVHREPSIEYTQNWITNALKDDKVHAFSILLNNEHIGNVVLDCHNYTLGTARISIYIGEDSFRGHGVGLTATYLSLVTGFNQFSLHKIWAIIHSHNIPSIRNFYKIGFVLEGILHDEFILNEQRVDALYLGLLVENFAKIQNEVSL